MTLLGLAAKNMLRSPLRTWLTLLAGAISVLSFALLRTTLSAWDLAGDVAAKDRISTRNKLSFVVPLPLRYVADLRGLEGVSQATGVSWFGGKDARDESIAFASYAVDGPSFLQVFDELSLPAVQRARWLEHPSGAVIGKQLAEQLKLKLGDRLTMVSTVASGDWTVQIDGIYTPARNSFEPAALLLHWSYLNEGRARYKRDTVDWISTRVASADRGATLARQIDEAFDARDQRTTTMSERDRNLGFVARFGFVIRALHVVSCIILVILALILANTIAMGVRERGGELAVLRALGFGSGHVRLLILGEAAFLGLGAGLLGLGAALPLINGALSRFVEENSGGMLPYFRLGTGTALSALLIALLVGLAAGALPALVGGRRSVVDMLRRVD